MAIPDGSHLVIGGFPAKLDMRAEDAYTRWSRSTDVQSASGITGDPGENLSEELRWHITNFKGEGQKIIDITDPESPSLFYRSEGLDFRTAGEFRLNKSTTLQQPVHTGGGGQSTFQGAANFADVVGTSTTSGTDRQLQVINDTVGSDTHTPGAGMVQADFYVYHEAVQVTTVQGNDMTKMGGSATVSGTDHSLESDGATVATSSISGLTNAVVYDAAFYVKASGSTTACSNKPVVKAQVVDTTDSAAVVVMVSSPNFTVSATGSTLFATLQFTAVTSHTYQLRIVCTNDGSCSAVTALADYVTYGPSLSIARTVTISVYNSSGASTVITQTLNVTATAAGSLIGSLTYDSAAATNYSYRVKFDAGQQRPWVDKVITTLQTSGADLQWDPQALDVGQGGNVWLASSNAAAGPSTWTYDFDGTWTNRVTPVGTANAKPLGMAHSDAYEYLLVDNKIVYQMTTSASNAYIAATTATARGVAVAQNRVAVLGEDSTNGTILYLYALDATSLPTAILNTVTVSGAKSSPDVTLRQRIVGTPTGFRYFVNYSDGTCTIYECDSSPTSPTNRILAVLDDGVKATAITHTSGKTFIAGQFKAESGVTARSALWMIDESGYLRFVGYLRRDADGSTAHVQMLRAYQGDVWMLQGEYVWRYSLRTGGLYLEYELPATTPGSARALAVVQGHQFAAHLEGVFVTGAVGTYRQSTIADGNRLTTSIHNFYLPGTRKTLWAVECVTDDLASGSQVSLEYQKDQNGTWTPLGTVTTGSFHQFFPSTGAESVRFNTLQVRATLGSGNGTATPVVKDAVVRALPIHDQHFLDARLLLTTEDSGFHVGNRQSGGGDLAAHLWNLKAQGNLVTVEDGFFYGNAGESQFYLARIEAISQANEAPGEGSALVRFRLLAEMV